MGERPRGHPEGIGCRLGLLRQAEATLRGLGCELRGPRFPQEGGDRVPPGRPNVTSPPPLGKSLGIWLRDKPRRSELTTRSFRDLGSPSLNLLCPHRPPLKSRNICFFRSNTEHIVRSILFANVKIVDRGSAGLQTRCFLERYEPQHPGSRS